MKRIPYTIPIGTPKAPMFVAQSHMKAGLEKKTWFPDPFAPEFRERLDAEMTALAEFKDDPWLLGVFIHNELPWTLGAPWNSDRTPTGIAALVLEKNDASMAVKRELTDWLRARYGTVDALNRAWGAALADWAAAEAPFALTGDQRERALADLVEMDARIARQYFRVCREAMDANLPGVLYLGCRFSGMYDRHFAQIAGEYCDVVSFNIYAESPSERTADELAAEFNFPVVIGEFHFGALDRGMFDPGLRRAKDQAERAGKYADYIRQAAAAPWCVGAHWFQYLDQALTGRPDGENYNIGFVDATDDPHPELRAAARKIHGELYRIRATPGSQPAGTEK
jgi:agarase